MGTGTGLPTPTSTQQMQTQTTPADWSALPSDLPVPTDDGAADHLRAGADPQVVLPEGVSLWATASRATSFESGKGDGNGLGDENGDGDGDGKEERSVDLRALSFGAPVLVFVYPRTGKPGVPNPAGWDAIPGARGCTPELCSVRDTLGALRTARPGGVHIVALSTQSTSYQSEVATRLGLPYPILSDEQREFSGALGLPTFEAEGIVLLKRITLLVHEGKVVGRDYPVFPTDQAAKRALELLKLLD